MNDILLTYWLLNSIDLSMLGHLVDYLQFNDAFTSKFIGSVNKIISSGKLIGAALMGISILIVGFQFITDWGGEEGAQKAKKNAKRILYGGAFIFGGSYITETIVSWFS